MLTEEEKTKIELEEKYRSELKDKFPKPKTFMDKIDGPVKLVQGFAIVAGIIFSVLQYSSNSQKERDEAARNFRKSFYEEQMKVYAEVVNEASILATADTGSQEYTRARQRFSELFWGKTCMFEDKCVESKLIQFNELLSKYEKRDEAPVTFDDPCEDTIPVYGAIDQVKLQQAALRLAKQSRLNNIKTWMLKSEQVKYTEETVDHPPTVSR